MNKTIIIVTTAVSLVFIALAVLFIHEKRIERGTIQEPTNAPRAMYCRNFKQGIIEIEGQSFEVAVAKTKDERSLGLSNCGYLPAGSGMYFPYEPPEAVSFWMKDMLIPLDIIWISDKEVIGFEANVPVPIPGTDLESLPRYQPSQPITGVLELSGGSIQQYNIVVGSKVVFSES